MKRVLVVLAAAALLPCVAQAQSSVGAWTQFVDPTENSFAAEVPQGWTVNGGVTRFSPLDAVQWVTAVSPDGSIQVFLGDPGIPAFRVPTARLREGSEAPPPSPMLRPPYVLAYRAGAAFAEYYAPASLAEVGCTGATLTGTQSLPDFAGAEAARGAQLVAGLRVPGGITSTPRDDAGLASFTCQSGGQTLSAGVAANTGLSPSTGYWSALVGGYIAAPGREATALAVLNQIIASRQWNPQWDEAMRQQAQSMLNQQAQQGRQMMAKLKGLEDGWASMLNNQAEQNQAALTNEHNAFMAQMNQQSASENAQFRQNMAQKSLNSWKFDASIRNGNVYRNPDTGELFEVDH